MSTETTGRLEPPAASPWAPEWWELLRERRTTWAQRHTALLKRLLIARLALLAVALVWLIVAWLFVDAVKPALLSVWFGAVWICVLWFLLLRTKTLTFAGYLRLFVMCVAWAIVIGVVLRSAAIAASPLAQEGGFATRTALASVGEEALKLFPLLAIALAAPGRVRRFAVADWALLGLASGAGFLAAEEILRRLNVYAPQVSIFGERYNLDGAVQFGLLGLDDSGVTRLTWWPGHHVVTMLVALSVGLGIALWRASRGRDLLWRAAAGTGAAVLVTGVFWSAVTTHAYYNLGTGTSPNILPAPLRWWHAVTPDEFGATWMLVLAVLVILLVDGSRLRRWGGWQVPVEAPAWAAHLDARLADTTPPQGTRPVLTWGWVGATDAARSLLFVVADTGRGIGLLLAAGARQEGEPWWAGTRRSQASVVMNRQSRELAFHLDAPPPAPWLTRGLAVAAAVVLLWLTFTVAPDWVRHLDGTSWAERMDESWLAQLFDGLDRWWNDLSGLEKLLAIGAVAALPALVFGLGTATAFAGLSLGASAWTSADHADETADFIRDPVGTIQRYWASTTPGSILLDAGTLALSAWLPGKAIQHLTPAARRVPALVGDYMGNPRAYLDAQRAWRRAQPRDERGQITRGHADGLARVNGRRPINYRWAGDIYGGPDWRAKGASNWTDDLQTTYPDGVPFNSEGFPDFSRYTAYRIESNDLTGKYRVDSALANEAAREKFGINLPDVPEGFVWHHVEDATTMQLVPEDIHRAVRHTGGVAVMKLPK
ncbi:HNH endonuclease [Aeromicrobium sp.]|uniref:HNH endonuclease n=1 Tax=Aeromicrobium sp. TaxID=1871063 RepID=UPI004034CCA1